MLFSQVFFSFTVPTPQVSQNFNSDSASHGKRFAGRRMCVNSYYARFTSCFVQKKEINISKCVYVDARPCWTLKSLNRSDWERLVDIRKRGHVCCQLCQTLLEKYNSNSSYKAIRSTPAVPLYCTKWWCLFFLSNAEMPSLSENLFTLSLNSAFDRIWQRRVYLLQ